MRTRYDDFSAESGPAWVRIHADRTRSALRRHGTSGVADAIWLDVEPTLDRVRAPGRRVLKTGTVLLLVSDCGRRDEPTKGLSVVDC